jgi:hypothetical protein
MRKRTLGMIGAVVLLAGGPAVAGAQMKIDWGVTGGVNFAKVVGGDASGSSNLTTFMAGLSAIFPVNPKFAIQPEALYSRKGSAGSAEGITGKLTLSYLDFPVLLKFIFPTMSTTSTARPALYFGPSIGVRLTCDAEATSGGTTISSSCKDAGLDTKTLDLGLVGGGGIDFGNLGVFARYMRGLTTIENSSDVKNSVITVGARWSFNGWK